MHDLLTYGALGTSALGALISVVVTFWAYRTQRQVQRALKSKEGNLAISPRTEDYSSPEGTDDTAEISEHE